MSARRPDPMPDEATTSPAEQHARESSGAIDDLDLTLLRLVRMALAATIHAGQSVKPPLTATQVRVLTLLAATEDGMSVSGIAEALSMSPPSASRLCQRMVRDGLVDRSAGPGHYIIMTLSEAGTRSLDEVNRLRVTPLRRLLDDLPERRRADMAEQLRELVRIASDRHDLW